MSTKTVIRACTNIREPLKKPHPLKSASVDSAPKDTLNTKARADLLAELEILNCRIGNCDFHEIVTADIAQMCSLLKKNGEELDTVHKDALDRFFSTLRNICREDRLDEVSRWKLLEVIEMRLMRWRTNENLTNYFTTKLSQLEEGFKEMEEYMNNLDLTGLKNVGNSENIGNLKKEHKALKEKNNNLEKEITELKLSIKRLSSYEAQCTELEKIISDLRQTIKVQQEEILKSETLEHNLGSVTTENQKLQRIIDTNQQRIKDLQQDLQSLENENQKLNNNVESLKLSVRKYHDLERESTNLETINHRLEQEMKGLEKENNRLKTAIEEASKRQLSGSISQNALLNVQNQNFSPSVALAPGEVLRSSGKFSKPTKIAGKNYFKDEIVIRNCDSGKVMGIKGRRVHMIEELSDTVISFQRDSESGQLMKTPGGKTPKGKQSQGDKRVSFQIPGKNTPNKTPKTDNSLVKKQPTPGKPQSALKEFKGLQNNSAKKNMNAGARDRLVQITGPHEEAIRLSAPVEVDHTGIRIVDYLSQPAVRKEFHIRFTKFFTIQSGDLQNDGDSIEIGLRTY